VHIRPARIAELPALQAIERAAGQPFADLGMTEIAQDEPYPLPVLAASERAGLLWVATGQQPAGQPAQDGPAQDRPAQDGPAQDRPAQDRPDEPVAYLMASVVDGCLHIEQVSVHPDSARARIGRALIEHAASRAAADGLAALSLTTFATVPWNAPYYLRCGFRVLADAELTPGLRAIRQHEAGLGLDKWPRVCMRREVAG